MWDAYPLCRCYNKPKSHLSRLNTSLISTRLPSQRDSDFLMAALIGSMYDPILVSYQIDVFQFEFFIVADVLRRPHPSSEA